MIIDAKPLLLQKPKCYDDQNISGWMMSEKLDGIRAIWDGKTLHTRNNHIIHAPDWFVKHFPPFSLDGELWTKRGEFEKIQSIVLDDKPTEAWREITYNVFEVPHAKGNFLERLALVKPYHDSYLKTIKQIKCRDKIDLLSFLKEIEAKGGEGVIVKNPQLAYFGGRSKEILKVKSFKDMEGVVIGYREGKGKYKNQLGSLRVRLENGVEFNLGSGFSDIERKSPPNIGDIITFKYYGLTKQGKPKFASFMRIREKE
jgi:DNA ligase-1